MTKTNPLGNMRHFARLNSTSHAIFSFLKQQKEGVKCVWNVGNCLPFVTFLLKETNFTRFHICFALRLPLSGNAVSTAKLEQNWRGGWYEKNRIINHQLCFAVRCRKYRQKCHINSALCTKKLVSWRLGKDLADFELFLRFLYGQVLQNSDFFGREQFLIF